MVTRLGEHWRITYSCVMFCAAAQPPEKTVNNKIRTIVTGLRPQMSLMLAEMTMRAGTQNIGVSKPRFSFIGSVDEKRLGM